MKKIDIKAFGEGQQIWFNIGRLRRVEDMLVRLARCCRTLTS